jgi:transcription antitermination factor NusG
VYKPGNRVKIVKGPHKDLIGLILKSELDSDILVVQLEISEQNIKITKQ